MDTDQIDRLGPAAFEKFCAKDNLIVNSSRDHDYGGWDYVIQSKIDITDLENLFGSCYVQLKTTASRKKTGRYHYLTFIN